MSKYSQAQQTAARAAATGVAELAGRILSDTQHEGATRAGVSKAAEIIADTVLGSGPPSPTMQAVVSAFLGDAAEQEADWLLAGHGVGRAREAGSPSAYAQPPALADQ